MFMSTFKHKGRGEDVDTPQIIPARCLKTVPKKTSVPRIIFEHIFKLYYMYARNNLGIVIPSHLSTIAPRNISLFLAPLAAVRQIDFSNHTIE